jgi:hypothetical protein
LTPSLLAGKYRRLEDSTMSGDRIKSLAAALAAAPTEAEADRQLAEGLRAATGALAAGVMRFEPWTGRLRLSHLAADRRFLESIRLGLGQPIESLDLRPGAALAEIQKGPAAVEFRGLQEVFFGQVPEELCGALEHSLGIGRAYELALRGGGELLGTASVFMPRDGRGLPVPELETWAAHLSAALWKLRTN